MSTVDWVTIEKFAYDVGMTVDAISKKVGNRKETHRDIWPKGLVWIKMQGRIYISRSGWDRWLETARACEKHQTTQYKSNSSIEALDAERESKLSPQIPTLID